MRLTFALGLTWLLVLGLQRPSSAFDVCRSKSGRMQLRDVCRPHEVNVGAVDTEGSQGPPGPPGPPGAPGVCECVSTTTTTTLAQCYYNAPNTPCLCGATPCPTTCGCFVNWNTPDEPGKICVGPPYGSACQSSSDCAAGFVCVNPTSPTGFCATKCPSP